MRLAAAEFLEICWPKPSIIGYLKCDEVIEGLTGKGWDTRDEEMYKVKGVQLEQPMLF